MTSFPFWYDEKVGLGNSESFLILDQLGTLPPQCKQTPEALAASQCTLKVQSLFDALAQRGLLRHLQWHKRKRFWVFCLQQNA
jgi:hypothetical protein